MREIATLDHTGFMSENLNRSERFYGKLFDAAVLQRGGLSTEERSRGYPPLLFLDMGGHRFEFFLAARPLPETAGQFGSIPRIAFEVSEQELDRAEKVLELEGVRFERGRPDPSIESFVDKALYLFDRDNNELELCHRIRDGRSRANGQEGPGISLGRISHVFAESIDIDRDVRFYVEGMGLDVVSQEDGKAVLATASRQLLVLCRVPTLSGRSLFRSGRDGWPVPEQPADVYRYKGAHCAYSVESDEIFMHVKSRINEFGGFDEGDHRADFRASGELSTYFYDPSGNRLQLIVLPAE